MIALRIAVNTNDRLRAESSIPVLSVSWALLLAFFALLTLGAGALSYTADEPAYVAGGYAMLEDGHAALEMLAQRGYPPLAPILDGGMLLLESPRLPVTTVPGWPLGFDRFAESFLKVLPDFNRAVFLTRMPTVWLSLLLAALIVRWARQLFGRPAGLLALACLVVDPTLLAHGSLATSDLAVTFFGTAALYAAWRWSRTGGWRWSLTAGALLGATLLSKISGPIWGACAAIVMVFAVIRGYRVQDRRWDLVQGATAGVLALVILWAGYGFQWGSIEGTTFSVPVPSYWESAFYLTNYTSVFYALGRRFYASQWWYFPLAFAIKNPAPLLLTWLAAGVTLSISRRTRRNLVWLLVFPMIYAVATLLEGMNLGYRHVIPVHPFLHIIAGGGLALWWRGAPPWRRWIPAAVGLWSAVVVLRSFPNELAFFSGLVGGPTQGYRYLADSNLDWGQRTVRQEAAFEAAASDQDGSPTYTGPPETPFRPAPGRYLVGASALQGIGTDDLYAYEWFRHWAPATTIDASLLVYDVPPRSTMWVAQCGTPTLPLDQAAIEMGFGRSDLRNVGFDCTQAWLYPGGGQTSGVYAIDGDLLADAASAPQTASAPRTALALDRGPVAATGFLTRSLAPARFSYLNRRTSSPFALYEWTPTGVLSQSGWGKPALPADLAYCVPAALGPADLGDRSGCSTLVPEDDTVYAIDGPLAFLGVSTVEEGATLEVETWWRVVEAPITRSFSIMAHLVNEQNDIVGNADGLGVWPMVLRTGDVFVQLHRFTLPADRTSLWLRTGAYWSDTMALWQTGKGADTLLVKLETR